MSVAFSALGVLSNVMNCSEGRLNPSESKMIMERRKCTEKKEIAERKRLQRGVFKEYFNINSCSFKRVYKAFNKLSYKFSRYIPGFLLLDLALFFYISVKIS